MAWTVALVGYEAADLAGVELGHSWPEVRALIQARIRRAGAGPRLSSPQRLAASGTGGTDASNGLAESARSTPRTSASPLCRARPRWSSDAVAGWAWQRHRD